MPLIRILILFFCLICAQTVPNLYGQANNPFELNRVNDTLHAEIDSTFIKPQYQMANPFELKPGQNKKIKGDEGAGHETSEVG